MSLMASDVKHLFTCLWVLRMSSLEKYLFRFFVHFLIGLCLSGVSALYILEIKPLFKVSLAGILYFLSGSTLSGVIGRNGVIVISMVIL